jgi:hypothetical protein
VTLTHPDPTPTLALTLTEVHAAATSGDLDGYTTGLRLLHGQTRACLHAVGGAFECEACDTPVDLDQLAAAPLMPAGPRPLARTAAAQAYQLHVAAHLVTLLPDVELSVSTWQFLDGVRVSVHSSENDKPRAAELELAGFRQLWWVLGGGPVNVVQPDSGTVHLDMSTQYGDVEVRAGVILAPVGTVQDDARTWAATTQPRSASS